jgi:hypothetical protein
LALFRDSSFVIRHSVNARFAYLERFPSFDKRFAIGKWRFDRRDITAPIFSIRNPERRATTRYWGHAYRRTVHYLPEEKELLEDARTRAKGKLGADIVAALMNGPLHRFPSAYQAVYVGLRCGKRGSIMHAHFAGMAAHCFRDKQVFPITSVLPRTRTTFSAAVRKRTG